MDFPSFLDFCLISSKGSGLLYYFFIKLQCLKVNKVGEINILEKLWEIMLSFAIDQPKLFVWVFVSNFIEICLVTADDSLHGFNHCLVILFKFYEELFSIR